MYFTYIIRCKDDSLYTGYTSNIVRRMNEHKLGVNSKYTRAKGFKKLEVYFVTNTK
ncbi:GIY-YIG nuclease family protein, partial [Clostridioides difficile]